MAAWNNPFDRHPFLRFMVALTVTIIGAFIIILLTLNLTSADLSQLSRYMAVTGLLTLIISYIFYRLEVAQWFSSLRWTLSATIVLTVLLVFVNVWVIARLMFVELHYVSLTTALLIFAGLSAITFGFFIAKTMTDRICRMSQAAAQIATGKFDTRLEIRGNDELAYLAVSLNEMAHSLQEIEEQKRQLEEARRNLVAWVSHDLRTPLTSMQVMIEALADGVVTDAETTQRYLENSRAEIAHLNRLINDLFELAQLDVGHLEMAFQHASLRDLVSDTIGSMNAKARQHDITLAGNVASDIDLVYMAPDKIQRVLYNLVDNAIKYTPTGENVTITARNKGDSVQVDVHNSGVTIDRATQPDLFKSFYRGERSRARSADGVRGTGLGLAIAKAFVEANHGRIWLTSDDKTGTTFSFTIPHQPPRN